VTRLRDGVWTRYDLSPGFPSGPILKVLASHGSEGEPVVWAGSQRSGLLRFADDGRWQVFDVHSGLPANLVLSLLATGRDGEEPTLWVTTPAVLSRLDRERWHSTDTRSGLPNDLVVAASAKLRSPTGCALSGSALSAAWCG